MSLRKKLLVLLASVVIISVSLSSAVLYTVARRELESAARHRLRQEATLLANLSRDRFKLELRRLRQWAKTPLVINAALNYKNQKAVLAFESYFKLIIEDEPYQSICLINRKGDCVAESNPHHSSSAPGSSSTGKKQTDLKAWHGQSSIAPTVSDWMNGRPATPITVPVKKGNKVIGVMRMVMDTGMLNRELLDKLRIGMRTQERAYAFNPNLSMQLPKKTKLKDPLLQANSIPMDVTTDLKRFTLPYGAFRYPSKSGLQLAGFARMKNSTFVFLVTEPLAEVLSPIQTMRDLALILTSLLLIFGLIGLFAVMNPVLSRIDRCRELVSTIRDGILGAQISVVAHDEIGQLTQGLNDMSAQLLNNRQALEDAEKEYRSIFENAVGGIFQTNSDGVVLKANPAFSNLFGASSPEAMIDINISELSNDPLQWQHLIDELTSQAEVKDFAMNIQRLDGINRHCNLSARAELDAEHQVVFVQGIIEDMTEKFEAEAARERAREMDRHLIAARLKALRFQVNPHFLFNVLNTLDILSRKAPERISDLLCHLARYLRYSLETRDDPLVPLGSELQAVEAYLEIEKTRFMENLEVKIEVDEALRDSLVPEMLFQPLVENAIKYGMRTSRMPLRLIIGATLTDGYLQIIVQNSGQWVTPSQTASGTRVGLKNLRHRLKLVYNQDYTMKIRGKMGWVIARIVLPEKQEGEYESD